MKINTARCGLRPLQSVFLVISLILLLCETGLVVGDTVYAAGDCIPASNDQAYELSVADDLDSTELPAVRVVGIFGAGEWVDENNAGGYADLWLYHEDPVILILSGARRVRWWLYGEATVQEIYLVGANAGDHTVSGDMIQDVPVHVKADWLNGGVWEYPQPAAEKLKLAVQNELGREMNSLVACFKTDKIVISDNPIPVKKTLPIKKYLFVGLGLLLIFGVAKGCMSKFRESDRLALKFRTGGANPYGRLGGAGSHDTGL